MESRDNSEVWEQRHKKEQVVALVVVAHVVLVALVVLVAHVVTLSNLYFLTAMGFFD